MYHRSFFPVILALLGNLPPFALSCAFGMAAYNVGGGRRMKVPPGGTTYERARFPSFALHVLRMKNNGDRE